MRVETLPSPGLLSQGISLRTVAARAISSCEISAGLTPGGKTDSAATLQTFFTACANALTPIADAMAPTIVSRVRNSATQSTVTVSEPLDTSVIPAVAAFALTGGATITGVAVVGSTIVLTGTGHAAAQTLTYTKPAMNAVRDLAGNQIATFSGALA